jgi:hypothetical protein
MKSIRRPLLLKSLLKETPDFWYDPSSRSKGGWGETDARPFISLDNGVTVMADTTGMTHLGIMTVIQKCFSEGDVSYLDYESVMTTDDDKFMKYLNSNNGLTEYLRDNNYDLTGYSSDGYGDYGSDNSNDRIPMREIPGTLMGRVWSRKKVISFWNEQSEVLEMWSVVQNMFKHFTGMLGPIKEYKVDWIERAEDENSSEMTSAESIGRKEVSPSKEPSKDKDGQQNFIAKLFAASNKIKKLDSAKLKAIRNKMHVLDPELKGELMKMSKEYKNKASEIADALGMTVAEFHSLYHVDEDRSGPTKLG